MERTRYIRREDFELTNRIVLGMLINKIGAINNPIHNLKVMTSFIRHNTFVMKPLEITYCDDEVVYQDPFDVHIDIIKKIVAGRKKAGQTLVSYHATGYANHELDSTEHLRS